MDKHLDEQLSRLISDAVADIEPTDRLAEIRERTSPRPSRKGWYAAGGAILAAAAVVTAIALAGTQDGPRADDPGPVATQTPGSPTPTPSTGTESPVPMYYVGDTPHGPRLYRYFEPVRGGEPNHGTGTVIGLMMATPSDPDYRTLWPIDSLKSLTEEGGVAVVTLRNASVHDRPPGMSEDEASLAVEQVLYTVQAAFQRQVPVQFKLNGNPIDQVFGVPTSEPLSAAPQLDVLALVSISNPSEGQEVTGSFVADGRASSYEGTVPWELRDASGAVVREGFAMAGMDDHLIPWKTEAIDVSELDPGSYTFVAQTSDPSNGEGPGAFEDTRMIVVR